ncbi:MAG: acylphosphatase [Rhodospirillaceae bacterium]
MKTVRAVIAGRVQGVWYRAWTAERAAEFGLSGWVRNRQDGTVEAVFSGSAEAVDRMVEACRKGPPLARVESVELSDEPAPAAEPGFGTLPTA